MRAEEERANPSSGRSRYIRVPLTTVLLLRKNTQPFYQDTTRHPCRAVHEATFPAQDLRASPMKEKRLCRFSPSDFFKAARMPPMYLPKNGDFNYLT